jgi:hypothetical protein
MPPVSRHQRPNEFASSVFLWGARSRPMAVTWRDRCADQVGVGIQCLREGLPAAGKESEFWK